MPKASKEQTLKVKLQARALFELGKYNALEEICEAIKKSGGSVSRQTLSKWINENPNDIWQIGVKVNDTKDIVNEKIAPQIIDKLNEIKPPQLPAPQNKHDAVKSAMIDRQNQINAFTEAFMEDIETNTKKTAYLGIVRMQELLLKNKSYYQGKEQTVGYENARNIDCIANATHKFAQILGLVSGNGISINNNTNIQNNQNNDTYAQENSILSEYTKQYIQEREKLAPKVVKTTEA